jgi:hypothetical protein
MTRVYGAIVGRILDACLPGAGLTIDGRLAVGLSLVSVSVLAVSMGLVAALVGQPFAGAVLPFAAVLYVGLIAIAQAVRWWYARRARFDPAAVRRQARVAVAAWMRDDTATAQREARALLKQAPDEPGVWRLWARITGDAKAARQAERLELERLLG